MGLLAVLVLALGAAACGGDDGDDGGTDTGGSEATPAEGRAGGEAIVNLTSFPDYMDPALTYTLEGWNSQWTVYLPLVSYAHAEGAEGAELIPGLAENLPEISEDGLTYKLKLRDGLKYSDGQPVKASDFEHTIKRVLAQESGGSAFYLPIKGAEKYVKDGKAQADLPGIEADDQTGEITITLEEPNGSFQYVLGMNFAGLVPSDTPLTENMTKNPPPGTGPFKIENMRPQRGFELVKNENYTPIDGIPEAKLDKITVNVVKNQQRQVQDIIQNKVDYAIDPPPADQLREVKARYKDRYEEFITNSTYYFFMNERVKPFDDENVRKAVNFAIDKRALDRLFGGLLEPGCNFLPPGMKGYEKIEDCPYGDPTQAPNIDEAKRLIKEAGAEGTKVKVFGNDEDPSKPVAEYLADVLNSIGLDAEPQIVEASAYFTTIGNQKTKAQIGFANWFQDFPHPANFTFLIDEESIQQTNNQNFGNVADPEIQKLLEEANKNPDLDAAAPQYAEVDRMLVEKAHIAPYGHRTLANFVSENVDFENCTVTSPLYYLDLTQLCLKSGAN
ncbi:MAG: ABC transporter substrate-binding protein [Actinomycetota bacterium]|nr:ABC transporter substrate-binding protein [Actinomycetota bacterium]MDQ5807477.1 ABC transporter substrate-binding protein [Actinomycetota bacterium]